MVGAMSWVGGGHIAGQTFWFGSLIILAALLPPGAFGNVAIGLLLVTAATRVMEAGTRGSIIVASHLSREHVLTSLALNITAGVGLAVVIGVLAEPMVQTFALGGSALVIQMLGLSVAIYAPAIVPLALLERRFAFKQRASVQAGATITASTVSVVAGLLGAGVWALVVRQLLFVGLLAILGWVAARRMLPSRDATAGRSWQRLKRHGAAGFMLFSLTDFVVFNADYLTVGHLTDAAQLGLYSLAFSMAFAPVTQFSAQIGNVLFPAAATSDPETIRRRTLAGVRLSCLVLLPMVPVSIVLAPVVIPAVLGERWQGMVLPFQILIVVGVAHAIVNVVGESLSGTGNIGFRAWVNLVWMFGMIAALIALVGIYGMPGAAYAHLSLYIPVALAYGVWGMRLLRGEPSRLAAAVRAGSAPVALQTVVTVALVVALADAGIPERAYVWIAASVGFAAWCAYVATAGRDALREARTFFTAGRRTSSAAPSSARSPERSEGRSPARY